MKTCGEYRKIGLKSLSNNWGSAIGVFLVYIILIVALSFAAQFIGSFVRLFAAIPTMTLSAYATSYTAASIIAFLGVMISLLVGILVNLMVLILTAPIILGLSKFFLNLVRGKDAKFDNLFDGFPKFKESASTYFFVSIYKFLWSSLFLFLIFILMIPSILLMVSTSYVLIILGIILMFVTFILGSLAMTYVLLRYKFVFYIINDSQKAKPHDVIRQSKSLMKGHTGQYMLLCLTYIGWGFLSVITCCIGFMFLFPYIYASTAAFYNDCLKTAVANDNLKYVTLLDGVLDEPTMNNTFNQYQNNGNNGYQNNTNNQPQNNAYNQYQNNTNNQPQNNTYNQYQNDINSQPQNDNRNSTDNNDNNTNNFPS